MGRLANCFLLTLIVCTGITLAQGDPNLCDQPGEIPNFVIAEIPVVRVWGTQGDITALSFETLACNLGTCWANWIANSADHPVIGQNMYRLKDGRFEHIGQAWLKHGFFALSGDFCSDECVPTDGNHLGVNCSDPYSAPLNGAQEGMGPKFEVNPSTGQFPYPYTAQGWSGDVLYKRLQVHNDDLTPSLNPGAIYFFEAQYVARDEVEVGSHADSISLKRATVSGEPGSFIVGVTGPINIGKGGVFGWALNEAGVSVGPGFVPGDGRYYVASKATDLGNGWWHYEFAVHNQDADRGVGSFTVPIPLGANISNVGFHDVEYHSGEPYDGTDWPARVRPLAVVWETEDYSIDPNANALRWGTLYNFRFDSDIPPASNSVSLGLFKPGDPATLVLPASIPVLCDDDGICDPGETCQNCPADCQSQGGGTGCCGDLVCDLGESYCTCSTDCGYPPAGNVETACSDDEDDDCDGLIDCADSDCCGSGGCGGPDSDGDSFRGCDCDDSNDQVWSRPGEVGTLVLSQEVGIGTTITWDPPAEPGAQVVTYDVLRSINPANFITSTECVSWGSSALVVQDATDPVEGGLFCYVVRAVNDCPATMDEGDVGRDSNNLPRTGSSCP